MGKSVVKSKVFPKAGWLKQQSKNAQLAREDEELLHFVIIVTSGILDG